MEQYEIVENQGSIIFKNRLEVGRLLAQKIKEKIGVGNTDVVVLFLSRGSIPIGFEVAQALKVQSDILVVQKIGSPIRPELGVGAITEDSQVWIDEVSSRLMGSTPSQISSAITREKNEVLNKVQLYRDGHALPDLKNKTVVFVDEGPTSTLIARVAAQYARNNFAKKIILAVPVCVKQTYFELINEFDEVICMHKPGPFFSIADYFVDFRDVSDEEVHYLLTKARKTSIAKPVTKRISRDVKIQIEKNLDLNGVLTVPKFAKGIVLFAQPNSSKRFSLRNLKIAEELQKIGIATLLFDLLTDEESLTRENVFDIPFLAARLAIATKWAKQQRSVKDLSVGFFAAGSGAAAAIWAASYLGKDISAIVARGGRPDLAGQRLERVATPTLLVVGGQDQEIIEINKNSVRQLSGGKLILIPNATHLFDEPNTIEELAREAALWFLKNFKQKNSRKNSDLRH